MVVNLTQKDIFKHEYNGVPLIEQLYFALEKFYSLAGSNLKDIPEEYDPIFFHKSAYSRVDPYRSGPYDEEYDSEDSLWELHGKNKTKYFLSIVEDSDSKNEPILTKEQYGDQLIIGLFDVLTKRYKRYLIKDLRKTCEILRKTGFDFARVFGQAKVYYVCNEGVTTEEKQDKLKNLVSEYKGEVKDSNILQMLEFFKKDNNVVSLIS